MSTFNYDWSARQVLVTGGAGFIGTHLVNRLRAEGARVRVLDNLSTGRTTWADPNIEFIEDTVTSNSAMAQAFDGCDVAFHLAAMVSVPECEQAPADCRRVNVDATATAARLAAENNASLVMASSCAVYGPDASLPCAETAVPQPLSVYGASKFEAEHAITSMIRNGSLEASCLRFFNVVGSGQRPDVPYAAAIPIFAAAIAADEPLHIFGDGLQTRDFVPVDLAVEAMLRSAAAPSNRTVNVATGIQTTILDVVDMISKACDRPASCVHEPPRPEDIRHSVGDITLLQNTLGLPERWGTSMALRDAVTQVAKHFC
ncbi:MAG: NAD-dependent epimerase/dehydratase family protein [Phycisphaerales bacterium]|nr:NAD-dependent epimerase/dehydratase family protein [Phycisphaerales bacterium]